MQELSWTILAIFTQELPISFCNHFKSSKKKLFKINNTKNIKKRRKLILELIRLSRNTVEYSQEALKILNLHISLIDTKEISNGLLKLSMDLKRVLPLSEQVIDVAYRRNVKGESIKSSEKIVSIFEPHTDIISKGSRDVVFGHKVTLTTGVSGMVLDVIVHDGNPSDSKVVSESLENHLNYYAKPPEEMVYDGCYYSLENANYLKEKGVKLFTFCKEKVSFISKELKKELMYFRAGIESTISMLKREFGGTRIFDKGKDSFIKSVKSSMATYNLFILARHRLKKA